jgi:hypothetical protein
MTSTDKWNIHNGHIFRPLLLSSSVCNQKGILPATCLVQFWLGPLARPTQFAYSSSNNRMVSVPLLAYPPGDLLCKLLSPRYQNFGDKCSILWAVEQEKQVYVSATGRVQHINWQSDRADICQLFTKTGEYLSVQLQPKPPWLYILINKDIEDEERGVHRHVEELASVQMLLFTLSLRKAYSELLQVYTDLALTDFVVQSDGIGAVGRTVRWRGSGGVDRTATLRVSGEVGGSGEVGVDRTATLCGSGEVVCVSGEVVCSCSMNFRCILEQSFCCI